MESIRLFVMRIIAVDGEPFTLLLSCHKMAQWRQTMYLEKYEQYLGTGERNAAGLDLKTFLEEYNPSFMTLRLIQLTILSLPTLRKMEKRE